MSPGGHLLTTAATCGAVWAGTGSLALTAGVAAGGVLIDVDHLLDYVLFERRRDLRPGAILRHYLEGRVRRAVLVLHSWELGVGLALLAWLTNSAWLWGYVLGMALHLPLDVVFNGRLAGHGLVGFYSFARRWRAGFRMERLCDQSRLDRLDESAWIVFFRGGRLRQGPPALDVIQGGARSPLGRVRPRRPLRRAI